MSDKFHAVQFLPTKILYKDHYTVAEIWWTFLSALAAVCLEIALADSHMSARLVASCSALRVIHPTNLFQASYTGMYCDCCKFATARFYVWSLTEDLTKARHSSSRTMSHAGGTRDFKLWCYCKWSNTNPCIYRRKELSRKWDLQFSRRRV
jgi:hypothetical protein